MIEHFQANGLSDYIRVDNGRLFGDPQGLRVPPLAMWLIGLGVGVIWNRPRMPQDNAKVERGQGVLNNWVEPHRMADLSTLKERLHQEAHFQRAIYRVQRLKNKTRLEAFPDLKKTGRAYNPQDFDLQRVLDFLAKGSWERTVTSEGQLSQFGKRLQAGYKYRNQSVSVRLDPQINHWTVYDKKGQSIKSVPSGITHKTVWNLENS